MLIVFRKQRDEIINLILNLNKKLNENKYKTTMKNNNRFVAKTTHVQNDVNQFKKLLVLKKNEFNVIAKTIKSFFDFQ